MKTRCMALMAASALLAGGCETSNKTASAPAKTAPAVEHKTVEMVANSEPEGTGQIRESMSQWAREGWNVLSTSALRQQADGKFHWKAELSRTATPATLRGGYDDRQIALIKRGETTEAQLLEWFGPPDSRDLRADGRAQLTWSFSRSTDAGAGPSGNLSVSLAADGKVESYSARRVPR